MGKRKKDSEPVEVKPDTKVEVPNIGDFKTFNPQGKIEYVSAIMDDVLNEHTVSNISLTFHYIDTPQGKVLTFKYRCTNPLETPYLLDVMYNLSKGGAQVIDSGRND
jgi:hypothetical protein